MRHQLSPSIETFFLLLNPHWGKAEKKETIKKLDDFGLNGVAFYAANFPLLEQYYNAFGSKMVPTDGSVIFEDMSEELVVLFASLLLYYPQWLNDLDSVPDEEVHSLVHESIVELLDGKEEIISALETSGFSDQTKWQITALLQQPKQRIALIINAINANLVAYEYAHSKFEAEIAPLIARLDEQLQNDNLPAVAHQPLQLNPEAEIIPSMAAPLGLLLYEEFCVYGLLANRLFGDTDESLTKTEVILAAKALSNPSKLEILLALKQGKLYNLEIARVLDLTPATTSHHMNMLLAAGLVEVSKNDGKVYYSLSATGVKRYRDWLNESLL